MKHPTESYFVRLDAAPPSTETGAGAQSRTGPTRSDWEPAEGKPRRRRRRFNSRALLIVVVLAGLVGWTVWASQRPGGVSGTVNGWIDHVRGDVAQVSTDPDIGRAATYFDGQYKSSGAYPNMSDAQLTSAGIGIGVTVVWCSPAAMVLQGQAGGGMTSHLLVGGHDRGGVVGVRECPADLRNPAPWKAK